MGIALIVLRGTGQQLLGDVTVNEETGVVVCHDPLQIGWVRPDKKLTRVLMTLSVFPQMIDAVADLAGHNVTLRATDVLCMRMQYELKPEAIADYEKRRQEVYGKIAVVHGLPGGLAGRA